MVFLVLIIIGIVFLIQMMTKNKSGTSSSESPLEILKKRYALGEINEEEYERRRKELES